MRARRSGIMMVALSTLLFSFNGLILRQMIEASALQVTFYRSASMSVSLVVIFLLLYGGATVARIKSIGPSGLIAGTLLGFATMTIFIAMNHTTVANTSFINSAIPFFSAGLAWVFLREKVSRMMMVCMMLAFFGITVMVIGSINANQFFGSLMSVVSALLFAVFVVILRSRQQINMTPVVIVSGVVTCTCIVLMTGGNVSVNPQDLMLCIVWGAGIAALGHSLFVLAAARLSAGEVTFIMLFEYVLGPVWVWLFLNEIPAMATLAGGAIVLGSVMLWLGRELCQVGQK